MGAKVSLCRYHDARRAVAAGITPSSAQITAIHFASIPGRMQCSMFLAAADSAMVD